MDTLLVELWEGGRQVAEFDLSELNNLTNEQADSFWKIQSDLNRSVMLKYKEQSNEHG